MIQAPGINLNGIVALNGALLVANSTTGKLFRVDPATGVADKLDLGGADLSYPDGLELLGHKLYVVRPFDNRVTVISLRPRLTSGVVLGDLTDPSLDIPTTATVAAGRCGPSTCVSRHRPLRPRRTGSHSFHSAREARRTRRPRPANALVAERLAQPATYTWSAERAVSGGEPAQSSSISRSVVDDAIRLQQEHGEHRPLLARPEC